MSVLADTGAAQPTRTALLQAATQLIRERGFDRVSVDQIAAAAGFTKGAFYSNFESKEEIAVAVLDEVFGSVSAWIDENLSGEGDPRNELLTAAGEFVRWLNTTGWPQLYIRLKTHAIHDDAFRGQFSERWDVLHGQLETTFAQWFSRSFALPFPIENVVTMLAMLWDGFVLGGLLDADITEGDFAIAVIALYRGLEVIAAEAGSQSAQAGGEKAAGRFS